MATAFRSCLESREMTRGPIFWAAFAPEEEEVATASGDLSHCVPVKVSSRPLKKVPTTTPRSGAKGRRRRHMRSPTTEPHSETALCRRGQVQTVLEGHEDNVMCAAVLSAISGRVGGRALAFCSVSASCSLRGELVAGWPETSHRLARPLRAALGGAGKQLLLCPSLGLSQAAAGSCIREFQGHTDTVQAWGASGPGPRAQPCLQRLAVRLLLWRRPLGGDGFSRSPATELEREREKWKWKITYVRVTGTAFHFQGLAKIWETQTGDCLRTLAVPWLSLARL